MENKINSYLNFAKKSGTYIYGTDNILKSKKIYLIIVSSNLSKNAVDKLNNKFDCVIINDDIMKSQEGVMAVGIADLNLAKAITDNLNQKV